MGQQAIDNQRPSSEREAFGQQHRKTMRRQESARTWLTLVSIGMSLWMGLWTILLVFAFLFAADLNSLPWNWAL